MKMIKLLSAGVILLSAASVTPVMAHGHGKDFDAKHHAGHWGGPAGFGGPEFRHFGYGLNLTEDQKATIKAQHETTKVERKQLHKKLVEARAALESAAKAGANDAELGVLADALGKLHGERELAAIKDRQAFLAVLTDEQKAKLAERGAKRFERKMEQKLERNQPKAS
jgi:protein CpxP